jgi:hypothetical protein
MKLKTQEVTIDGKTVTVALLDDKGLPVYVHDNGQEVGFDAPGATNKIGQLNREAQGHREAKEAAETKLKAYEGIEDPEKAKEAIQTVANLAAGELKTAAQVQEIKDAATKAAKEQVDAAIKAKDDEIAKVSGERDSMKTALDNELIGGGFSRSKFVGEKLVLPADIAQAQFGKHFKVEDGKLVAYDAAGGKIYSTARPGELANFDEAIETLVNAYPAKDSILKGEMGGGGGAGDGGGGGGGGAGRKLSRAQFDAMTPQAKAAAAKEQGEGKLTIVD